MKKLITFIIIGTILCLANLDIFNDINISTLFPSSKVEVYIGDKNIKDKNSIINGDQVIIFTTTNDLEEQIHKYKKIDGYTIIIKDISIDEVIKKIAGIKIKTNKFGVWGKSNFFTKSVKSDEDLVNFQIIDGDGCVLLGIPILLGSY